jgi:hypothetical protein
MKPDPSNPPEPFPRETIPPEVLAWARQTFDEEESLADIRAIEATGGCDWRISSPSLKRERGPSEHGRARARAVPGGRVPCPRLLRGPGAIPTAFAWACWRL